MISLLRNCVHGSDIALYRFCDADGVCYIKTSYTQNGILDLRRENAGWRWYVQTFLPEHSFPINVVETGQFFRLQTPQFPGKKYRYADGLSPLNKTAISTFVAWYVANWPGTRETAPMHGDLSLDNILFDDQPYILDWEHFTQLGPFWGFDACYLLFETMWFHSQQHALDPHFPFIAAQLKRLSESARLPAPILDAPLACTVSTIRDNMQLWGDQLQQFESKLPILLLTDGEIAAIDEALSSVLS